MNFFSLNKEAPDTTFKDAVIRGLAPDRGLYFPEKITPLSEDFFKNIDNLSHAEIAFEAIKQFVSPEIPEDELKTIVEETLSFDFPIVELNKNISFLELFHGPTMAFKDVGARFMARCLGHFSKDAKQDVTVLVATSGDTGGAVANGFLGVEGVKVVILYPSGKVSDIQEKQLTTLKKNITALEVNGTFDDCQDMVKQAFLDAELTDHMKLTSANSINVARWLPQLFYFMFAYKQLHNKYDNLVFSIPSGNFGNVCAGMMAQQLGLPITHYIASNNENNVVTRYLESEHYDVKPSIQTISNAMDVGNPSNFVRIQEIYKNDFSLLKENLSSYSFTDEETKVAMKEIYNDYSYVADPHGAVGYLGAKNYVESHPEAHCVCLETAHPTKFLDVVGEVIKENIELPAQILAVMDKKKKSIKISTYNDLKTYLLNR
ncbi:threonine synthase [Formosa algae]|uniref:Threonine synthase n=1 Tax=Formosa algae TaxID=225843 RepID=A0A9X0YL71_9FLAO|nr:threonine synthase [Formosa algae]MBP1840817.1 threonine synthase [Formosa algae]MDQ0336286.1 threonine synthase [Formosa algae]OEI80313.1 threonine synthase [Formosa algae]